MVVDRHDLQKQHLKALHSDDLANGVHAREPGIGINIGLPLLPTVKVTLLPNVANAPAPTPPAGIPNPAPNPAPNPSPNPAPNNPAPNPAPNNPAPNNPAPAPAPPATPPTNTPPSSSGGSNGGNTGNGGGSQPSPATPGSSQPDSSGGQSPSSPNTSGGGGSDGSGTVGPGGIDSPASNVGGKTGAGRTGTGGTGNGINAASTTTPNGNINLGAALVGTGDEGGDSTVTEYDSSGHVINAGVIPPSGGGQSGGGTQTGSGTFAPGKGSPSLTGSGAFPSGTDDGGGIADVNATKSGASKGIGIAIGIIVAILFLIGLVILLRRHRKARREQRLHMWWFSRKRTSQTYNDDKAHMVQLPAPGTQSARSSFGTTFDRSVQFDVNFGAQIPSLPPAAEVRRSRNDLTYPISIPATSTDSHDNNRYSLGLESDMSHDSNFFIVDHRPSMDTRDDHHSPRDRASTADPFGSPSERFAFPKPPSFETLSTTRKSGYSASSSRPNSDSNESFRSYETPGTSPTPHDALPALPVFGLADPFADPTTDRPFTARSSSSRTTNPFSDSTISHYHDASSAGVEPVTVYRPFSGDMEDELTVVPGDQLKVLQIFDDGWAVVDRFLPGAADNVVPERGLVPLGCLR